MATEDLESPSAATEAPKRGLARMTRWMWLGAVLLPICVGMVLLFQPEDTGEALDLKALVATQKLENGLKQHMRQWLATPDSLEKRLPEPMWVPALTLAHYQNGGGLVWVQPGGLNAHGYTLLRRLRDAGTVGLLPRDYHQPRLDTLASLLRKAPHPTAYLQAEFLLSDACLLYTRHLRTGKLDSTAWMPFWQVPGVDSAFAYASLLQQVQAHHGPLDSLFARWEPTHPEYRQLQRAMRQHLAWQRAGVQWVQVPTVDKLSLGESHPLVPYLRRRLLATADLPKGSDTTSQLLDSVLVRGLMAFQERHGLNADGVLGRGTIEALNVPLDYRVEQLRLNLARWHWQPRDWGTRHIWVNVPEGRLRLFEQGHMTRTMRVIVGRKKRPTPLLSSRITHLLFNPPWNVPGKMIEEDILPQLRRNPAFLANMRMQLVDELGQPVHLDSASLAGYGDKNFPYQVRQDPGWGNSLGRVLFMFPNNWSVYLHDTPDRWLFQVDERALSSGCVRLEHPLDLADYLLKDLEDWSPEKRAKVMDERDKETGKLKQKHLSLPEPMPVHLYYHTARADAQGRAWFFTDPYAHDEKRLKVLWARHPRCRG